MKEDISVSADRGESPALMEPLLIAEDSRHRGPLIDLSIELSARAAGLRSSLAPSLRTALGELVRSMNCYYSNLIEGHDTHPIDVERALRNDYSENREQRDLQLEAKAHIAVQRWLDAGNLRGQAVSVNGVREMHRRFCELLPERMLRVEDPDSREQLALVPGELRQRHAKVARHVAISPGAIPRFLERFEQAYSRLGKSDAILAAAAAHHRLLWIHPFLDGNGRVARLMSHAMLLESLDTGGVWSVARGLARNDEAYKAHLAECDLPRRNDLDGRGNLSEEALAAFTRFFLATAIDQVTFMEGLVQPDRLRTRAQLWAEEEIRLGKLPPKSVKVLDAVLQRGELPRADVAGVLDVTPRHGRRIVSNLLKRGVLTSKGVREPLHLALPAALASRLMPGLFPDKVSTND